MKLLNNSVFLTQFCHMVVARNVILVHFFIMELNALSMPNTTEDKREGVVLLYQWFHYLTLGEISTFSKFHILITGQF